MLPEDCDLEAGYIKLFFSTTYVDWSEVALKHASAAEGEELSTSLDEKLSSLAENDGNLIARGPQAVKMTEAPVPPWGCIKYTVIISS